jgi:hypothetical protein
MSWKAETQTSSQKHSMCIFIRKWLSPMNEHAVCFTIVFVLLVVDNQAFFEVIAVDKTVGNEAGCLPIRMFSRSCFLRSLNV